MTARRRTALAVEAERANAAQLAALGAEVRRARLRRRLTQAQLGARTGLSRMAISRAERGLGGGLTLDAWQRIGIALGVPVFVNLRRDHLAETRDAPHLAMQELVLRTGRGAGYTGTFELPTKPLEPARSIDVGLIDDRHRRVVVDECWNTVRRHRCCCTLIRPEGRRGGGPRARTLGRRRAPRRPGVDRSRDCRQPGARRALPRGVRRTIPGLLDRVGGRADHRRSPAVAAGADLVRRGDDPAVRVASFSASMITSRAFRRLTVDKRAARAADGRPCRSGCTSGGQAGSEGLASVPLDAIERPGCT